MAPDPQPLHDAAPFPFPAVLAAAAQASLGGPREALLALVMACRLAHGLVDDAGSDRGMRQDRAQAARQWLGTLTLAMPVRTAIARLFDATVDADPTVVGASLLEVLTATGSVVPPEAAQDVRRLVTRITS